jgi:hypothetical protein
VALAAKRIAGRSVFHVAHRYQPLMRMIGLDAEAVFDHPDIVPWRTLPNRENCTLDADLPDRHVRLHVKRFLSTGGATPAEVEVRGHQFLIDRNIPTAELVGWGQLADRRSFVIFDDLAGYRPADKVVEGGAAFESLLEPTADLAAKLHDVGLHHRDLYLCHFMARVDGGVPDTRLIDAARVRPLPRFLSRRWIVKDLAQFWYSTLRLPISVEQRSRWLARYAHQRRLARPNALQSSIERKSRSIARHDAILHRKRPERDVSLPP